MNPPHLKGKQIGKEDFSKLKAIIESLEKDPRALDFLIPVDYVGKLVFPLIFIFYIFIFSFKSSTMLFLK